MAEYACMIQEGQAADGAREALARGLREIGREFFGDPPPGARIAWFPIAPGFGYTAGLPSRSSVIARSVPVGFADDRREAFMRAVCDLWKQVTGCGTDEIVVTALDGPLPL